MAGKIRIKFSGRIRPDQNPAYWQALFRDGIPEIGSCQFFFDPDERNYDWLVVYEDLMYPEQSGRSTRIENLACAKENTLLITQEPSAIKIYGPRFLSQYGHVLSAQPANAILHENHILQVSPIRWFYGRPLAAEDHNYVTLDDLSSMPKPEKILNISTVCSDKQMTRTLKARFDFTQIAQKRLGEDFDWFGRGIRAINDKAEAMNSYKYHLAVENHIFPHYWTEKIADSFLAYCLPFYYGPENISDYFNPESFIPIDIFQMEQSVERMKQAVMDNEYDKRLPAIITAREKVLHDYNLMNVAAKIVREKHQNISPRSGDKIMGRHAYRRHNPLSAFKDVAFRSKYRKKFPKT